MVSFNNDAMNRAVACCYVCVCVCMCVLAVCDECLNQILTDTELVFNGYASDYSLIWTESIILSQHLLVICQPKHS